MVSNRIFLLALMVSVVVERAETSAMCTPDKLILLSNCTLNSSFTHDSFFAMNIANRTLSMTVPYALHTSTATDDDDLSIKLITRRSPDRPLIRFNLNMIHCSTHRHLPWSSVEASSTLRGEFIRTTFLDDTNLMYLSSGVTYLRNLTSLDCSTRTLYRTDHEQFFRLQLKIESKINDYCTNDHLCYPLNIYQCDYERQRCICRAPLQSYLTSEHYSICIHAVNNLNQCSIKNVHCLPWCHPNSSSTLCLCPEDVSTKKYLHDERAFCEGRTSGTCNAFIRCPPGNVCALGTCQPIESKLQQFIAFDIVTISIIVSSLILFVIIVILGVSICILRRRRWKKRSHSSLSSDYKAKHQMTTTTTTAPLTTCDYDNIIYGVFRHNVQLSSSTDDQITDSSPFTSSDTSSYNPKIVYLGGEQQLTAIYA